MRLHLGIPTLALITACGGGTIDLDEDTQRRCPAARVDTESVEFDAVLFADAGGQSVEFRNGCTANTGDLLLTLAVDGSEAFTVSADTLALPPGETTTVDVFFTPADYAAGTATLTVSTNDPDVPTLTVPLSGTVNQDQDGDGFTAAEAGGTDCDDLDAEIKPGATETWYDGVDQNCDGASDFDQDGDGFDADPDGPDCDDLDPGVFPEAPELNNQVDDDCDGYVDEDFLRPNDVVVTEVMADPVAVFDTDGEWFEIENTSGRVLNLRNWTVTDYQSDSFTINGDFIMQPGDRRILGVQLNPAKNGGVDVDYLYPRASFDLANASDAVGLEAGGNTVTFLEYEVNWGVQPGASLTLDPLFVGSPSATVGRYWCSATSTLSAGDKGTPGAVNDFCTSVDHDGDGYSIDTGDCDDDNGEIYPGAPEDWNSVDDDCDGVTDNAEISGVRAGYLDGSSRQNLSYWNSLSVGDVDDDGDAELLVGSVNDGGGFSGVVYTLDPADAQTWAGSIESYDEAMIEGIGTYNQQGFLSPVQRDVTGDGTVDLVIGGLSRFMSGGAAVAVHAGSSANSGRRDTEDATAVWLGGNAINQARVASHLDLNGDGVAQLLYSDPFQANGSFYSAGIVYLLDADGASGEYDVVDDNVTAWRGTRTTEYLGTTLDGADFDGDGYDDAVMCGLYLDFASVNGGGCAIVSGDKDELEGGGIDDVAKTRIGSRSSIDRMGNAPTVAIGDFDDSGKLDLALPIPNSSTIYVYLDVGDLSGSYDTSDADVEVETSTGPSFLGMSVAAGDIDGDGVDDLVAGAPDSLYFQGYAADEAGRVWIWSGDTLAANSNVSGADAYGWVDGETTGEVFGFNLLVTDLDGDGRDDIVAGASNHSTGAGRVSILLVD